MYGQYVFNASLRITFSMLLFSYRAVLATRVCNKTRVSAVTEGEHISGTLHWRL